MGPTRYPYGQARGFVNHFNYRGGTAGDITGSSTPNVTEGQLFYTNNTGALTITNFLLSDTANRNVNYEGKLIYVMFLDTATQIANGGALFLQGTDNLSGTNHGIELMYSRGNWIETDRWKPNQNGGFVNISGAATLSVNVNDVNTVVFVGTASTTLQSISGGQVGQTITLIHNTGGITLTLNTAGNIRIAGTNALVAPANSNYELTNVAGLWFLARGAV